jgi:hypothetical protein
MREKMTKAPMRWRYEPGGYGDASYRLRQAGADLAIVAPAKAGGWYSYGLGLRWNTCSTPCSLEEAKADALARARQALKDSTHG